MPIIGTLPTQLLNGTVADAPSVMTDFNYIVQQVNANAAASGNNNDITALLALTTPITPAAGGSSVYTSTTPSAGTSAYTVTGTSPLGFALVAGRRVSFLVGATNTANAVTLSVEATTVKPLLKRAPGGNAPLAIGDLFLGQIADCEYDGTNWILMENISQGFGALGTLASAATTDIGAVNSHNVSVTGVTTITSFGSSASLAFPIYRVTFTGILTLTHTPVLLVLPNGADITTAAGDSLLVVLTGTGNWTVIAYFRATGRALTATDPFPTQTGKVNQGLVTNGTTVAWSPNVVSARASFSGTTLAGNSFNAASVSNPGTGIYDVSFSTALANTDYQVMVMNENASSLAIYNVSGLTTAGFRIQTYLVNGVPQNFTKLQFVVFGGI